MKSSDKLLYAALLFLGACSKSEKSDPEPIPAIILNVVQKETRIPDATVMLTYDDNGQPKTLSGVTNNSGRVILHPPLNKQMQMTITSKCGIVLYDYKAGPFTETTKMDTTLEMSAYSPDCEPSAPDQYFTSNTFGVINRWTSFDSNFGFWITSAEVATYSVTKKDNSAKVHFEMSISGIGAGILGIWTPKDDYYSSTNMPSYFERGDYGEHITATFTSLSSVNGGQFNNFPDEKLTGSFRFIRHHYKEDPNWPMFFPR